MQIKLSYIIGVNNETKVLDMCIIQVLQHKQLQDEVVVVTNQTTNKATLDILQKHKESIKVVDYSDPIKDFSVYKNYKKSLASEDSHFIFDLDADEIPNKSLLQVLPEIILNNPEVDLYWVPRINIVEGITPEYIQSQGWQTSIHKGATIINFPDFQGRIYANKPHIQWKNKVHEQVSGHKLHSMLPAFDTYNNIAEDYTLLHIKTFQDQVRGNERYAKMIS